MKTQKFKQTEIGKIPKDWEVKRVGELAKFKYGLGESAQEEGDFIYIRITDINSDGTLIKSNLAYIDKDKVKADCLLKKGDVLVARTGATYGKTYYFNEDFEATYGGFLIKFLFDKKIVDNNFFFQFSRGKLYWNQANNLVGGGAQPQFNANVVSELMIPVPPLPEQQSIASILSSLDNKIELNQKMNKTLEAIGQALFKRWFVDFEFPNEKGKPYKSSGGEMVESELEKIPKGWKVETLESFAKIIDCLHTKKPEKQEEGKVLLQVCNFGEHGLLNLDEKYLVSDSDYTQWTKNIEVIDGDCLLTNAGLTGAILQIPSCFKSGIGRNITAIRAKNPYYLIWSLFSDNGRNEIEKNIDRGTIFDSLNVKGIKKVRIVTPSSQVMNKFEPILKNIRKSMEKNNSESWSLSQIRDSLLPKLMSGEIRVNGK